MLLMKTIFKITSIKRENEIYIVSSNNDIIFNAIGLLCFSNYISLLKNNPYEWTDCYNLCLTDPIISAYGSKFFYNDKTLRHRTPFLKF